METKKPGMENYREILDRIHSFEKSETDYGNDYFTGNPSIAHKVGKDNKYKDFYGDTIVFNLDNDTKEKVAKYVDRLYQSAPECFSEKLKTDTFHMTLHDLSNSPVLQDVSTDVFENELRVIEKSKKTGKHQKIRMKTNYVFNMVNISLVLGLYPASEEDYNRLMELYYLFDDVRKLGYPLTPHITLGYYSLNGFDGGSARRLEKVIQELNQNEFEIVLDTDNLYYQKFVSMNQYINVICLG